MTNASLEESTQQRGNGKAKSATLLRLYPTQISQSWDLIAHSIKSGAPNIDDSYVTAMLRMLMEGVYTCWVLSSYKEVVGFVITTINPDPLTGQSLLVVNQIYGLREVEPYMLRLCFEKLRVYGQSGGCDKIVCQVSNKQLLGIFKDMGAKIDSIMVELEV